MSQHKREQPCKKWTQYCWFMQYFSLSLFPTILISLNCFGKNHQYTFHTVYAWMSVFVNRRSSESDRRTFERNSLFFMQAMSVLKKQTNLGNFFEWTYLMLYHVLQNRVFGPNYRKYWVIYAYSLSFGMLQRYYDWANTPH